MWETSRDKLKKHSVTKKCSDLSLFEQIVLVIENIFWNFQPSASNFKIFSRSQFVLTVGQNNFGNKITFLFCTTAKMTSRKTGRGNLINKNLDIWILKHLECFWLCSFQTLRNEIGKSNYSLFKIIISGWASNWCTKAL